MKRKKRDEGKEKRTGDATKTNYEKKDVEKKRKRVKERGRKGGAASGNGK